MPIKKLGMGFVLSYGFLALTYGLFSDSIGGIDLMGPNVALFMLFHLVLMLLATVLASYFWFKIPLPLSAAKSLSIWVTLPVALLSIQHKEMGWSALELWASSWQNHQFLLIFNLIAAYIWSRVAPWFSLRFFYPEQP
jgi:hypothetical protein